MPPQRSGRRAESRVRSVGANRSSAHGLAASTGKLVGRSKKCLIRAAALTNSPGAVWRCHNPRHNAFSGVSGGCEGALSRLFISHSSRDNVSAKAFKQWLGRHGWSDEDVFFDLDDIGAGERWKEALRKASTRCEAVILLVRGDGERLAYNGSAGSVPYEHPSQRTWTFWGSFEGGDSNADGSALLGRVRVHASQRPGAPAKRGILDLHRCPPFPIHFVYFARARMA